MKKPNRRNRAKRFTAVPTAGKARWNPLDNTRAQTFADRRAVSDKRACRGRVALDLG